MDPIKKLKNKRGMTLVEVLTVVALMTIMLGIAMPDLISESRAIKFAGMNGNARAVAVAVQSKLYGMKNKGTAIGSEFDALNGAAGKTYVQTSEGGTSVRYFANFGETAKTGSQILSGALTDVELLKNGKIVVVYDPNTADILEVFYAEDHFLDAENSGADDETGIILPNAHLFPAADESYLAENMIGSYFGDPKPDLSRKDGLPPFTAVWRYDDELYLELQMVQGYSAERSELWDKPLGIEVYAEVPDPSAPRAREEFLIYAEGMFASPCNVNYQRGGSRGTLAIAADYTNALTLSRIESCTVTEGGKTKSGVLRFAIDSLVTTRANYGNASSYLRHQINPGITTMLNDTLYPRETIANWFNNSVNPYLSFWKMRRDDTFNAKIDKLITDGASATQFVDVDQTFCLHVKMYVLDDTNTVTINDTDNPGSTASVYPRDNNYGVLDLRSPIITPYFYALSTARNKVTLSSVRDLNNLPYVFETENNIDTAALAGDISAQTLYNKIVKVHNTLLNTNAAAGIKDWGYGADFDTAVVDTNYFRNKEKFTLSGKKSDGGSYKIVSVPFAGQSPQPGGLFAYAENCTFEYLDIVNPKVWRSGYSRAVLGEGVDQLIPYVGWGNVASGALAAVAVNCTFTNVRTYIDPAQTLKTTDDGEKFNNAPFNHYRISGSVVGGLVGVAVGSSTVQTWYGSDWQDEKSSEPHATTFTNCAASTILCPEYYYVPGECFVAGGLVGVTVGDVQIANSYASSQLTGYYAGGLVGAVGSADVKNKSSHNWCFNWDFPNGGKFKGGKVTGSLKITNSFAAGVIQHTVRVGGGLIALISGKATVEATDCYSAVNWQIVPPVAYGTFKGDEANYYLYPTTFDLPVTANVVARFTTDHSNVFSLQGGNCGIACSSKTLTGELSNTGTEPGTQPALKDEWVDNTKTTTEKTWFFLEQEGRTYDDDERYPFPMPKGNTEFWGTWAKSYDKTANTSEDILTADKTTSSNQSLKLSFDGYYVARQTNEWKMYSKCIDTLYVTTNNQKIGLSESKITIGSATLDDDGATLTSNTMVPTGTDENGEQLYEPGVIKSYYWAQYAATEKAVLMKDAETAKAEINCGQGVENGEVYGATKITPGETGNTICFASAQYYSSSYDPLKGSEFYPGIVSPNVTRLMWDYYGFYLLPEFNPDVANLKYYIITTDDNIASGDAGIGTDTYNQGTQMAYANIKVNKDDFVNAIGYRTITLPMPTEGTETSVEIIWDPTEGLHVKAQNG